MNELEGTPCHHCCTHMQKKRTPSKLAWETFGLYCSFERFTSKQVKQYYLKNERDIRFQFLRWVKYRSQFIISVRTENVSEFKPASLWSLVTSPQRHLFCMDDDVQAHFPRSSFNIRPSYKFIISGIITLFHSLTTWGLQNAQTTRQCYTVKRTGKIRWADNKMATLNKPTFTLLTS